MVTIVPTYNSTTLKDSPSKGQGSDKIASSGVNLPVDTIKDNKCYEGESSK